MKFLYLDLPRGAEWMIRGAWHHPLGFKQHPLEDAGRLIVSLDGLQATIASGCPCQGFDFLGQGIQLRGEIQLT